MLTGALVGGHWLLFFASIKVSTVSATLVCLYSITLFIAIFKLLINKTRILKSRQSPVFLSLVGYY